MGYFFYFAHTHSIDGEDMPSGFMTYFLTYIDLSTYKIQLDQIQNVRLSANFQPLEIVSRVSGSDTCMP